MRRLPAGVGRCVGTRTTRGLVAKGPRLLSDASVELFTISPHASAYALGIVLGEGTWDDPEPVESGERRRVQRKTWTGIARAVSCKRQAILRPVFWVRSLLCPLSKSSRRTHNPQHALGVES